MNLKSVFILGGNGFVGSAYERYYRNLNYKVTVIGREDYSNYIGSECDILINANGNSKKFLGLSDPKKEFRESVLSVRESLIDFKYKKYVYLSTSDIYPDCSSPELTHESLEISPATQSVYGFHKYLAELCVQQSASDWLIVRQGGFVGKGLKKNAIYDVLFGQKLWVHPESRFQFINTDTSARLVSDLIAKGLSNEILNLTALGTISVNEILNLIDRKVAYDGNELPKHYEISTEKASKILELPETRQTILDFIESLSDKSDVVNIGSKQTPT